LLSAERFSDKATWRGLLDRKTFGRRSSALLCLVTRADQRLAFDGLFADLLIGTSNQKEEQGSPLFLTLRKPIPHRRDQWSTLPKLVSRAAEYLRVPFLPRRAGPWPGAGCRGAVAAVVGRDSYEPRSYGLNNGTKASRYRHTRNSSRAVKTSAGGKPSGAIRA